MGTHYALSRHCLLIGVATVAIKKALFVTLVDRVSRLDILWSQFFAEFDWFVVFTSRLDAYTSRYGDFCANDDTTDYFTPCAGAQGNYCCYTVLCMYLCADCIVSIYSSFDCIHTHAHIPLQWMMLSLINPPFTSRESTDSPDCALSSPLRSLSAAGAYRPSPKFVANASVRLSPFPSPIAGDVGSAFTPTTRPLGGAFTPYKRPVLKRPAKSPVMK